MSMNAPFIQLVTPSLAVLSWEFAYAMLYPRCRSLGAVFPNNNEGNLSVLNRSRPPHVNASLSSVSKSAVLDCILVFPPRRLAAPSLSLPWIYKNYVLWQSIWVSSLGYAKIMIGDMLES